MRRILVTFVFLSLLATSMFAQIVAAQKGSNGQYGFVDANGQWVVQPQYDYAYWHEKEQCGTVKMYSDRKEGAYNKKGELIVHREYDDIKVFASGLIIRKTELTPDYKVLSYYGVVDHAGKTIIPIGEYHHISMSNYYTDLIEVWINDNKKGVYNIEGKLIVPCDYKYIFFENRGIIVQNLEGYEGVYSRYGKKLLDVEYADLNRTPYGKYNIINKGGNLKINSFDNYQYDGGGKWGACDSLFRITIPCEYDGISDHTWEDIVPVNRGGKTDKNGKTTGGKWGFWANGKEIIPCQYDEVSAFNNGVATVKKDGNVQLIKNPLKDGGQIQIAENASPLNKKERGPVVSRYPAPDSDVDKNIPTAKTKAENTFAFIICNENYPDAPVPYSLNDGRMFREYCQKALGLPEKNINMYEDATFGNIITAVEKMKQTADAFDGDASIIFYYAGHGFPDDKQQSAYLLPIDGNASDITTTGYSLAKFYKELAAMKLKSAVVFLDACFSGAKREDQMLAQSRGVAIKVKSDVPDGNMVVFSAAQGDETAHQMEEKHHGLFTYFLLKELQATGGDVDMGTLTEYVTKQVKRQSVVINNKKQTPTVIPSQALTNSWQTLKLK